jgi:hypothetical protein
VVPTPCPSASSSVLSQARKAELTSDPRTLDQFVGQAEAAAPAGWQKLEA